MKKVLAFLLFLISGPFISTEGNAIEVKYYNKESLEVLNQQSMNGQNLDFADEDDLLLATYFEVDQFERYSIMLQAYSKKYHENVVIVSAAFMTDEVKMEYEQSKKIDWYQKSDGVFASHPVQVLFTDGLMMEYFKADHEKLFLRLKYIHNDRVNEVKFEISEK
ncbi:hypothetical protein [Aestuariispira insulae]|uniref:Uncharacterized protein n=1 Tax=Aestuariispira insulae TaxID=1461337 RepID=A0A3D9HQL7_9PROT|nr:hypothetical protein [Aestuariispira insulae]RED51206.1 hypothetical protein DFP90_1033 [Aestuariispira insulae]